MARVKRQIAKDEGRLELYELDLQVQELCEKNFHYRKVEKFLYAFAKKHFGLNTIWECKKAIWLLQYNLLKSKYAKRRTNEKAIALRGMRMDPEFNRYFICSRENSIYNENTKDYIYTLIDDKDPN
jgi:hypothetical protein